jgi:hypothetical protein
MVSPFVLLRADAPMESGFAEFRLWRHQTDMAGLVGDFRSGEQNRSDGRSVKPEANDPKRPLAI